MVDKAACMNSFSSELAMTLNKINRFFFKSDKLPLSTLQALAVFYLVLFLSWFLCLSLPLSLFFLLLSFFLFFILFFSFLGSGPEGADDLCFHTGENSPPSSSPPPSSPSTPSTSLEAQNLASRLNY